MPYPIIIVAPESAEWRAKLEVFDMRTGNEQPFRLYVHAGDGRWYKQKDPEFVENGQIYTVSYFGHPRRPRKEWYGIVALQPGLRTVLDELPQDKVLSNVVGVKRV